MSKRWLWFKDLEKGPVQVELHDIDAAHALAVDPENWSVDRPGAPPEPDPDPVSDPEAAPELLPAAEPEKDFEVEE